MIALLGFRHILRARLSRTRPATLAGHCIDVTFSPCVRRPSV
jgi:hypothetical protein